MFSIRIVVIVVLLGAQPAITAAVPAADVEGKVRFYNIASPSFDVYSFTFTKNDICLNSAKTKYISQNQQ